MNWLAAAIYDRFMRASESACLSAWRRELLGRLSGDVLEVGAGTGANLSFYPASVSRLVLAEPDVLMRARLSAAVAASGRAADVIAAPIERLPFAAGSFDAVVCTLVLCSVGEPAVALAELRRVLRPGGALAFLEHVAADGNPRRLAWQRAVQPLWRLVSGNCHLTRRTAEHIAGAGFVLGEVRRESIRKAMAILRPSVRGIALAPGADGIRAASGPP